MTQHKSGIDLLVLDAHGVVFTSSVRQFLLRLADERRQSKDELLTRWQDGLRLDAWTGAISESDVWARLGINNPIEIEQAKTLMEECFDIGCGGKCVSRWSQRVPVWMLSNHRSEWLLPRIQRFDLGPHFANVVVSDQIGAAKPDSSAFDSIVELDIAPSQILFVDDQPRNLDAASRLGLQVIQASDDGTWTKLVDEMLDNHHASEQSCQKPSSTTCSSS